MADATAVDDPLSSPLPVPPLSPYLFSQDFTLPNHDDLSFDYEYFGITLDDDHHPPNTDQFFNSDINPFDLLPSDHEFNTFASDLETVITESGNSPNFSGNQGSDGSGLINIPSQQDGVFVEENMEPVVNLENENPVSSHGSAGSEPATMCPSPDSGNSVVNQKVNIETESNMVLKRKKNESCDVNSEARTVKYQKANETSTVTEDSDEKKKARLIRNRESAQLSRQRKKHYVEELEDKVRAMQATIQDLNARISYFAAENATLKQQQMVAGGGGGVCPPPVMYPPHPAMAPMGYPWMPYVFKSQGSQVPLVPIPRLPTQQPASSQKSKKDVKKTEGRSKTKTKKVASISFLGLLLFLLLFGGLVPLMNVKYGGVKDVSYHSKFNDYKIYKQNSQRALLLGDEHVNGTNHNASEHLFASLYVPRNDKLVKIDGDLIIYSVLASEKAMALREEHGTSKTEDTGLAVAGDLVPAIPMRNSGRQPHMYRTSSEYQRALPSNKENLQAKHADGKPQQWFREGFSGLMLSSGMCTEVFQFDASVASASGAIVPATSVVNITATENSHNSTNITTMKNRRILHSLPIPLSNSTNITKEQVAGLDSKPEDRHKHNSVSSMVVSVLVDPREAGDGGDMDGGMMGGVGGGKGKSFSRIFVVVLLDSVKYVTYSCMLPSKGTSHL